MGSLYRVEHLAEHLVERHAFAQIKHSGDEDAFFVQLYRPGDAVAGREGIQAIGIAQIVGLRDGVDVIHA